MGDGGMDPCGCIWEHELMMRRLLNVIRNSQNVCTDNECFEDNFRSQTQDCNGLMVAIVLIAVVFIYLFRPRTQRINDPLKPTSWNNDNTPPSPPSTMS